MQHTHRTPAKMVEGGRRRRKGRSEVNVCTKHAAATLVNAKLY